MLTFQDCAGAMHVVILKVIRKMLYLGMMYRSELDMLLAAELYLFDPHFLVFKTGELQTCMICCLVRCVVGFFALQNMTMSKLTPDVTASTSFFQCNI